MVSHYEHGRSYPPLPVALGLEIILRVPVAFLFPGLYFGACEKLPRPASQK